MSKTDIIQEEVHRIQQACVTAVEIECTCHDTPIDTCPDVEAAARESIERAYEAGKQEREA